MWLGAYEADGLKKSQKQDIINIQSNTHAQCMADTVKKEKSVLAQ